MNDTEKKRVRELVRGMLHGNKVDHEENKKELAKALRSMANLESPYERFGDLNPIVLEIWNLSAIYLEGKEKDGFPPVLK